LELGGLGDRLLFNDGGRCGLKLILPGRILVLELGKLGLEGLGKGLQVGLLRLGEGLIVLEGKQVFLQFRNCCLEGFAFSLDLINLPAQLLLGLQESLYK